MAAAASSSGVFEFGTPHPLRHLNFDDVENPVMRANLRRMRRPLYVTSGGYPVVLLRGDTPLLRNSNSISERHLSPKLKL